MNVTQEYATPGGPIVPSGYNYLGRFSRVPTGAVQRRYTLFGIGLTVTDYHQCDQVVRPTSGARQAIRKSWWLHGSRGRKGRGWADVVPCAKTHDVEFEINGRAGLASEDGVVNIKPAIPVPGHNKETGWASGPVKMVIRNLAPVDLAVAVKVYVRHPEHPLPVRSFTSPARSRPANPVESLAIDIHHHGVTQHGFSVIEIESLGSGNLLRVGVLAEQVVISSIVFKVMPATSPVVEKAVSLRGVPEWSIYNPEAIR